MIRDRLKWLLFPGINLHARLPYRVLPQFLPMPKDPDATVLDAGCGNGMLTYQAYRKGYRAIGVSMPKLIAIEGYSTSISGYRSLA